MHEKNDQFSFFILQILCAFHPFRLVFVLHMNFLLICPRKGTEYCDECVCLPARLFVCLHTYFRNHTVELHDQIFCLLLMAMAWSSRSSSVSVVIRYAVPVLWTTSDFPVVHFVAAWRYHNSLTAILRTSRPRAVYYWCLLILDDSGQQD